MTASPTTPAAERWLVLSYWANIDGMACSQHLDDRLPHLQRLDVEPEVITSICGPRPTGWGRLWHRVPSVTASGFQFEVRQITRPLRAPWRRIVWLVLRLPIMPLYALEKHTTRIDPTFWWCLPAALAGLWLTRRRKPDLIYSTGGAMSAHAAAAFIARLRRLPWIAEMQDPIVYQGLRRGPVARRMARYVERVVHSRATGVVYVTSTAARRALERTPSRVPCAVIRPGAEPAPLPDLPARSECMEIVHIGTLARRRNPGTLLEALARLTARRPSLRRELRVSLIGNLSQEVRRMAGAFPHPEMVRLTGKLSRSQARAALTDANLLLVIQHTGTVSQETIPSKTYEYLVSGRPVLGLTFRNPELAQLLRRAGHDCVEVDDVEAVERALEAAHARWKEGRLSAAPCLCYTPSGAAQELLTWSRRLAGRCPPAGGQRAAGGGAVAARRGRPGW